MELATELAASKRATPAAIRILEMLQAAVATGAPRK